MSDDKKASTRFEFRGDDDYFWEASLWVGVGQRMCITGITKFYPEAEKDAQAALSHLKEAYGEH